MAPLSFFRDIRPENVFTPRSTVVNKSMYVDRPEYERELKLAMRSGYHIVIYGDSGCGKSWLYKKVFDDESVVFATLDLNNAETADDIELMMLENVNSDDEWVETERTITVEKGAMPYDIGRKTGGSRLLKKKEKSAFELLCQALRRQAKSRKAFIVFENLEHALGNREIIGYLRSLVLALDDIVLSKSEVRICFVGVPTDIKMILSDQNKFQTISNRVTELPEISRMSREQARHLIKQGFETELEMNVESFDYCISQIVYLSDRIPQYLHDLCLQIAFVAEVRNNTVSPGVVVDGAHKWVETNGRQSREFIEAILGPSRRRQDMKSRIILAIAKWDKTTFYSEDIALKLKEPFPVSLQNRKVNVIRTLNKLACDESRLLKYDRSTKKYHIASPKLRSVLRHCVYQDAGDEAVLIREEVDSIV